ncbi:aspartic proteinase nepenthesin-2-like [Salvia splendens]|uniref:aspartic proteinase nepenthesin-2-like n=1 Tax=Salvia splendens TaxID=180675 RepID=UPI001C277E0C|nr:aspartic proteinase nepenthesin-2-like [Salvia splendens]
MCFTVNPCAALAVSVAELPQAPPTPTPSQTVSAAAPLPSVVISSTSSAPWLYLYVGLTGISVGGKSLRIQRGAFAIGRRGREGVIVDSGTTVTRFPAAVYAALCDAFRNMTGELRPQQIPKCGISEFKCIFKYSY